MVVTDCDIKPVYNRQNPRKVYLYSKANWEEIYSACERLSVKIQNMINLKDNIEHIWATFKSEIQSTMDTFIPSKTFKKNNTVPWFNRKLKKMCRRKARLYKHAKKSKAENKILFVCPLPTYPHFTPLPKKLYCNFV